MNSDIRELSKVLAELGVSESANLVSALNIVNYLGYADGLQLLAAGERQQLGGLLLAAKRLSGAQLEDALAAQRRSGAKLGEILVQRGLLSAAERDVVLAFQQSQGGQVPNATKLYLGNVLVAGRAITREQLADALDAQIKRGGRLGESLIASGHLSEHQVKNGLQLQRKLIAAVLLAALALVPVFPTGEVQASNKMATVHVSAVVRASAHLRTDHQATYIKVTAEDIARGYVEVRGASKFFVATPKGANYFVDFHPRSDLFVSVLIDGLGSPVELGAEGGSIAQPGPGVKGAGSTLDYRFRLSSEAQPGVYAWPLTLEVRAR